MWLVVLRINVDLAIFQPYLDLEAGDNQSLKIQVARPSSRNSHQEYSSHLYSGGTSPPPPPKVGTFGGGAQGKTHLYRVNVPKSLQMRHRVYLNA